MKKNNLQNAWRQFEKTGSIADYLHYKALETGGSPFDPQNPRPGPGTDPYAGPGSETHPSYH